MDSVHKVYNLKSCIITLILNYKGLYLVKGEQVLCTAVNGETAVKLKTLTVRKLDLC